MARGAPDRLGPSRGVWPQGGYRMAYRVSSCRRDIPPGVALRGADVFARALQRLFALSRRDLPRVGRPVRRVGVRLAIGDA